MTIFKTYDHILQGHEATEDNARLHAQGIVWNELETIKQSIACAQYIDTVNGIGIYYDFGADYYFFTDEATTS